MSKDQDREFTFTIAIGNPGVGKTYLNKMIAELYIKKHYRPVLIYDNNMEYTDFGQKNKDMNFWTLDYDNRLGNNYLRGRVFRDFSQSRPHIRTVITKRKDGSRMSIPEIKELFYTIAENYFGGLLIMDDAVTFGKSFRSDESAAIMGTLRHGRDLILSYQKIADLQQNTLGVAKDIRLHKVSDEPFSIRQRISCFMPLQIAYLIVEKQYADSYKYLRENGLTLDDYKKNCDSESYKKHKKFASGIFRYIYVGVNPLCVKNVSDEEFAYGVKQHYLEYESQTISRVMKLNKCDQETALNLLVEKNKIYLG